jgi:hypothetical protein
MEKVKVQFVSEAEYKSDNIGGILFEDEHSHSFAIVQVENVSLKFGWNSKGVNPGVKLIEGYSFFL